nr:hypothetical protein [bacterium]
MKKYNSKISNAGLFLLLILITAFLTNCGNTSKSSDVSLNVKAPKFAASGTYTATAAAYDKTGTLISSASGTITNMQGSLVLNDVPVQADVSIAVAVKQLNSDTVLIRGSKIINITEGQNTVDITLGKHQIKLSGVYQNIGDMVSFNNFSIVKWESWTDTSPTTPHSHWLSKFDEAKGVFTGNYLLASDTKEWSEGEIGVDSAGNIFVAKFPEYEDTHIRIYAVPANGSSALLVYDTYSASFANYYYYCFNLISDKDQNLKLTIFSDGTLNIYNLKYNAGNLTANSLTTSLETSFYNSSLNTENFQFGYDINNRFHIVYYSSGYPSGYSYNWIYSDDNCATFSARKTIHTTSEFDPAYAEETLGAIVNFGIFAEYHTAQNDTSALYVYRILDNGIESISNILLNNDTVPPTQFHAFYSFNPALLGGNDGKFLYYTLFSETHPYLIISADKGATWSSPISISDESISNYSDLIGDANNKSAKCILIGNYTFIDGQGLAPKKSLSPKYGCGMGMILKDAYLAEQFGARILTPAQPENGGGEVVSGAPVIYLDDYHSIFVKNEDYFMSCMVFDTGGTISNVTLYYKKNGQADYTALDMSTDYPNSYHCSIGKSFTESADTIYYYFRAYDNESNTVYRDSESLRSTLGTVYPLTLIAESSGGQQGGSWVYASGDDHIGNNQISEFAFPISSNDTMCFIQSAS